jgi:hypothetical protein
MMTGTLASDVASRPWLKFYDPHVPAHLDYPRIPLYAPGDYTHLAGSPSASPRTAREDAGLEHLREA